MNIANISLNGCIITTEDLSAPHERKKCP